MGERGTELNGGTERAVSPGSPRRRARGGSEAGRPRARGAVDRATRRFADPDHAARRSLSPLPPLRSPGPVPDDPTRHDSPTGPDAGRTPSSSDPPDDTESQSHAGGFTLDLTSKKKASAPKKWRRQRKMADPLTTKVFDFTQPKPQPAPPTPDPGKKTSGSKQKTKPTSKKGTSKGAPKRPAGGARLADLLDPETLARLRGDE